MKQRLIGLMMVAASAPVGWSHPGHGTVDSQHASHFVFSFEHAGILFAMLVAMSGLILTLRGWSARSRRSSRPRS
jgi:hypothetical protein